MTQHVVKAGESLYSIAASYRIADWRVVYRDARNAALRKARPDPNHIKPGDTVYIPASNVLAVAPGSGSARTSSSSSNALRIDLNALRLQTQHIRQDNTRVATRPIVMPKAPPEPWAEDFTPDHVFYEYLAHDFAYLNGQGGGTQAGLQADRFLYRAETPALWGMPELKFPAAYAVSSKRPYSKTPGAQPLYYTVVEMAGSDPHNKTHGVFAYWLQPSRGNHPIIAIRGTEFEKAPDAVADMDPAGVGATAFKQTRTLFQTLMTRIGRKDIVVVGHSLGGAMAQRVAVEFGDTVLQVVTFNSPGVDRKTANRLKAPKGPLATHYLTQGDVVSLAGETLLAGSATILEGVATAELRRLLKNGSLRKVDDLLTDVLTIVFRLAVKRELFPTVIKTANIEALLVAAAIAWAGGDAKAAQKVGGALGNLHSQRLLGPNGATKRTQLTVGPQSASQANDNIHSPIVEEMRRKRLGVLNIPGLYLSVMRQIDKLLAAPVKSLMKELLSYDSPLSKLARTLLPPLVTLKVALDEVGGMQGLVVKSLHLPPPKFDVKVLQPDRKTFARDNTYVAPRTPLINQGDLGRSSARRSPSFR
ncbi:lipase family protein [Corallococcus carmarthensis]|uniref:lipase family protein n=1 Tax=Corallococcus carmarthensis TaxID=2316728 RepID=UPI00148E0694|nr:LysM peptidoglycan-binding domain-containing protein [Corallococcus carmarthensis]NOK22544.1 LysM peptidoglycan-binding domain-containing protein [Corallococcus carmarthensis]